MAIAVAATLATLYLGGCALVFFAQRGLVFPAPAEQATAPSWFEAQRLPGGSLYLWSNAGDGPVVVYFHGNAEQAADTAWLAQAWRARGVSFAAVEYPGYPGASGRPSEQSLVATGIEAVTHLIETKGIPRERLVVSGQSVGTGVAMALAAKGYGARLILLSPYTSLPDVAAPLYRWLPMRSLVRDRFDSLSIADAVHQPTLIVHGTADEVIPFELGKRLAHAITDARLVAVEGAGHNDLWEHSQTRAVLDFVGR
ncbi:MAG: alpha/beta hydrolase [Micrococcales bacterium]|nr:alpha/beta hydrolase [Micrococcales bacterium]